MMMGGEQTTTGMLMRGTVFPRRTGRRRGFGICARPGFLFRDLAAAGEGGVGEYGWASVRKASEMEPEKGEKNKSGSSKM